MHVSSTSNGTLATYRKGESCFVRKLEQYSLFLQCKLICAVHFAADLNCKIILMGNFPQLIVYTMTARVTNSACYFAYN